MSPVTFIAFKLAAWRVVPSPLDDAQLKLYHLNEGVGENADTDLMQ
jgi:hypothetical protein